MSKRGSVSSATAGGGNANEHEFESFVNGKWVTDYSKIAAEEAKRAAVVGTVRDTRKRITMLCLL